VDAATGRLPVSTWETVVVLTPEIRATSEMVAREGGGAVVGSASVVTISFPVPFGVSDRHTVACNRLATGAHHQM
jgi:hypothetical protein